MSHRLTVRPLMTDQSDDDAIARMLQRSLALKEVRRAGWVQRGVRDAESVADHSWGIGLAALLLTPPELDTGRVLAIAAVHDLAEVAVGDLTPADAVPKAEKSRLEREAMAELLGDLGPVEQAE